MATKTLIKFAKNINGQENPNYTKRESWNYCDKAIKSKADDSTYAVSHYSKTRYIKSYKTTKTKDKNGKEVTTKTPVYDYKLNFPWTLTAHLFELDSLPNNAHIDKVQFFVRMRISSGFNAYAPSGMFCIYGSTANSRYDNTGKKDTTGWFNGLYIDGEPVSPSGAKMDKLSTSWRTYMYTLSDADFKRAKYTAKDLKSVAMGIDLRFSNPTITGNKNFTGAIQVAYVYVKVTYTEPVHTITYSNATIKTASIPQNKINSIIVGNVSSTNQVSADVYTGMEFQVTAKYTQSTIANGGTHNLKVELPWGTEFVSATTDSKSSFNSSNMIWTVNGNGKQSHTLKLNLIPYVTGVNTLKIYDSVINSSWKYNVYHGVFDGYDDINITFNEESHKNHKSCININIEGYSDDDTVIFAFNNDKPFRLIGWTLENSSDVTMVDSEDNPVDFTPYQNVRLKVTPHQRFIANLRFCYVPQTVGKNTITVYSSDMDKSKTVSYTVLDPYTYHISSTYKENDSNNYNYTIRGDEVVVKGYRVASVLDTNATVVPFKSDDIDAIMYQSPCKMGMYKWEELDYIGCVPLEHLHFDPKSTYKDKLLDTKYKNKRYMGKQLASDEDISLKVRLHPNQVPVIQGLIDMDKPIPINANHRCFESDPLNHRGWAEIYGITVEETNPSWYKCDIDVKYLTHNLNTRMEIIRGSKVNNQKVSELLSEVVSTGDPLSAGDIHDVGDDVVTEDFFTTDTDGSYFYNRDKIVIDEDTHEEEIITIPDNLRNVFSIDNGQHIYVKTRKPLSNVSQLSFEWNSSLLDEIKENNISRVIRLIDSVNKNPVFEYEYTNFVFELDYSESIPSIDAVSCDVVYRVFNNEEWEDYTVPNVDLRIDVESGGVVDYSDDDNIVIDDEDEEDIVDENSEAIYGSTIHFNLNNHKLTVIDEGFNGQELVIGEDNDINLDGESYYWETYWVNNNADLETNDVIAYFDFIVDNSLLDSVYADKYSKMIVSPFPVSDKDILFTREAEEGTIYYLKDDGDEFSYLIDPYYIYHNGTDMVTQDGVSRFSLIYGDEIIYIQNGLVRLGFNRVSDKSQMYLGKYDVTSGEYVTTHTLHFTKYHDVNVKSISDDKIELQASDCIFTIWRGHPYIMIKHELEDILIDTKFNRVWGENVNNDVSEYPSYYNLMNDDNILPSCVGGGNEIKSSCVDVESVTSSKIATTLNWSMTWSNLVVGENTFQFTDNNPLNNPFEELTLDNHNGMFGDYTVEFEIDNTLPYELAVHTYTNIIQKDENIPVYAKLIDYDYHGIGGRTVYFFEAYEPTSLTVSSDKSIIQTGDTVDISAKLKDVDGSLVDGERINFFIAEELPYVYYNDGTDLSTLTVPSDATVTVEDGSLKMTTSTNGEKNIAYNYDLTSNDNFVFECEIGKLGTSQSIAMYMKNSNTATGCWFAYDNSTGKWNGGILGSTFSNVNTGELRVGDKVKIKQQDGVITIYHNDTVVYSKTESFDGTYRIGHYTNRNRVQYIKNISILKMED